jgi:hypothetical protein
MFKNMMAGAKVMESIVYTYLPTFLPSFLADSGGNRFGVMAGW